MNYNEILKNIAYLEKGIKYNELRTDKVLALVIIKDDKVIYSHWGSFDCAFSTFGDVNKLREYLSRLLILSILKVGIHTGSNISNQTLEEYRKRLDELTERRDGIKLIED